MFRMWNRSVKNDVKLMFTQAFVVLSKQKMFLSSASEFLRPLLIETVASVQPAMLFNNQVTLRDSHLVVNSETFPISKPCYAVGFGKAVLGMAFELQEILGDRLQRAIVTVPKGIFAQYSNYCKENDKILFIEGALNNIPDRDALAGAEQIKDLVQGLNKDDLLIVLISGGGSALLPLPKPPVLLEEKQAIIRRLSRGGATIQELNVVRKHLSLLKGGGLAKLSYPCRTVSLILSDVVGDPLDVIASGPTVYYQEEPEVATEILKKYGLYETAPISIKNVLKSREIVVDDLFLKEGQFKHVSNFIIGTNRIATQAARRIALDKGWQCVIVSNKVEGDVDKLAKIYAQLADFILNGCILKIKKLLESLPFEVEEDAVDAVLGLYGNKKILLIFAGEPTVLVKGSGKGGRNQQLALAFSVQLNKQTAQTTNSGNISLLSAGTDGIDGPTDAAGAIGFSGLVPRCFQLNINPEQYLDNNDSYTFFSHFLDGDCLVKLGHTGTNVMDLHFLTIEPCCSVNK